MNFGLRNIILLNTGRKRLSDHIVIADGISFSSGAPDSSLEHREKRVLQLIRHLKNRYGTPVLALDGWNDLSFGEKIAEADYSIKYPRIYDKLREAVHEIIEGTFDAKAAQTRKVPAEIRIHRENKGSNGNKIFSVGWSVRGRNHPCRRGSGAYGASGFAPKKNRGAAG
jgi:hypothetical protein